MIGLVASVKSGVPQSCIRSRCRKSGCSSTMGGLPASRVLVDLDCEALNLPGGMQRCDFVYFDEDKGSSRVAPIELKSGSFDGREVRAQLQGGATVADGWIPQGTRFRLIPVLVHRRRMHKREYERLRKDKISLRGQTALAVLMRCGEPLKIALDRT